ncbi:MAG: hypothetical protein E6H75_06720 [Betaproteobacteria bacterium]|nr:MAG: hypothetical protein E6H75_06720 [Betaproteobacteria bacterium]
MAKRSVLARLDDAVDDFCRRTRYFQEDMTKGRARMFAMQHRLNTRQRNSVLKLKVATNCPDWDTRIGIIRACSEEVIADHEHGGGRAHWEILEDLGTRIGLKRSEIRAAAPIPTTQLAWVAWEGLMGNRHWLEGIVANTCAERANVPGYGTGIMKKHGWFGLERHRWGISSSPPRIWNSSNFTRKPTSSTPTRAGARSSASPSNCTWKMPWWPPARRISPCGRCTWMASGRRGTGLARVE